MGLLDVVGELVGGITHLLFLLLQIKPSQHLLKPLGLPHSFDLLKTLAHFSFLHVSFFLLQISPSQQFSATDPVAPHCLDFSLCAAHPCPLDKTGRVVK